MNKQNLYLSVDSCHRPTRKQQNKMYKALSVPVSAVWYDYAHVQFEIPTYICVCFSIERYFSTRISVVTYLVDLHIYPNIVHSTRNSVILHIYLHIYLALTTKDFVKFVKLWHCEIVSTISLNLMMILWFDCIYAQGDQLFGIFRARLENLY